MVFKEFCNLCQGVTLICVYIFHLQIRLTKVLPPSGRVNQVGVTFRLGQSGLHNLQIRSTKVTSPSNLPSFFLALALVVPFFPWPFFLPFLHCMHFKFIDVSPFAFDPTDLAVHLSIFLAG